MMLNAAWSAFENTLFLWGFSKEEIEKFSDSLVDKDGYTAVENSLLEIIDLEDV